MGGHRHCHNGRSRWHARHAVCSRRKPPPLISKRAADRPALTGHVPRRPCLPKKVRRQKFTIPSPLPPPPFRPRPLPVSPGGFSPQTKVDFSVNNLCLVPVRHIYIYIYIVPRPGIRPRYCLGDGVTLPRPGRLHILKPARPSFRPPAHQRWRIVVDSGSKRGNPRGPAGPQSPPHCSSRSPRPIEWSQRALMEKSAR
jgi:hypothetical protein